MHSETSKYRYLTTQFCRGNGLDLGSAGDPVVPTAIQVELAESYCPDFDSRYPVQLRGDATKLYWFADESLDYVYSSHLLEDFADWHPVLKEWDRVLKRGGMLIILIPDKQRWATAVANGQPPNLAHQHEGTPGELTAAMMRLGPYFVVMDECPDPNDYTIVFIARKL